MLAVSLACEAGSTGFSSSVATTRETRKDMPFSQSTEATMKRVVIPYLAVSYIFPQKGQLAGTTGMP